GFPGLPLAIAFPRWQVTLLEATEKKVGFQREAASELGLANVSPQAGRSEEVARDPCLRGQFDVVTARAVAALPTLLEYCCPFAAEGGQVIAWKQGDVTEELRVGRRAALLLGAELRQPLPVTLPQLPAGRCIVAARQMRPCPEGYPRAGGAPRKKPLGMSR
ncbi:MAG TPA: 16S rRNA (guanine(527)-N(7))-methyltransferase RsmG, partial [Ktedonobacterales bacterium]